MALHIHQEMFTWPIGTDGSFNPEKPELFADNLDALKKRCKLPYPQSSILTTELTSITNQFSLSEHFETWYCAMIAYHRAEIDQDTGTIRRLENHYSPKDFPVIMRQGQNFYPTFPPAAKYITHLLGNGEINQDHLNNAMNFIQELGMEPLNYGIGHDRLHKTFQLLVPHESGRLKVTDQLARNFASTLMLETTLSALKRRKGMSISDRLVEISSGLNRYIPYRHIGIRTEEMWVGDYKAVSQYLLAQSLNKFEKGLSKISQEELFAYILGNGFHFQPMFQGNKRSFIVLATSISAERNDRGRAPIDSILIPDLMHGMDDKLTEIQTSIMNDGPSYELISPALVTKLANYLNSLKQVPLRLYCDSMAKEGLIKLR